MIRVTVVTSGELVCARACARAPRWLETACSRPARSSSRRRRPPAGSAAPRRCSRPLRAHAARCRARGARLDLLALHTVFARDRRAPTAAPGFRRGRRRQAGSGHGDGGSRRARRRSAPVDPLPRSALRVLRVPAAPVFSLWFSWLDLLAAVLRAPCAVLRVRVRARHFRSSPSRPPDPLRSSVVGALHGRTAPPPALRAARSAARSARAARRADFERRPCRRRAPFAGAVPAGDLFGGPPRAAAPCVGSFGAPCEPFGLAGRGARFGARFAARAPAVRRRACSGLSRGLSPPRPVSAPRGRSGSRGRAPGCAVGAKRVRGTRERRAISRPPSCSPGRSRARPAVSGRSRTCRRGR